MPIKKRCLIFPNNICGLSIIELLIAVALLSIVLAIGYNFFFLNYKAYQTGQILAEVQFDTRMASDYITFELRNVQEVSLADTSLTHHIDVDLLQASYPKVSTISFTIVQSGTRYLIEYSLTGSDPGLINVYQINSEVLLNNISNAVTGSGDTLYYSK